jgi:hypothetical protein
VNHRLFFLLVILPFSSFSQQRTTHHLSWTRLTFSDTLSQKLEWEFGIQHRTQNNYSGDPNIFHSFQFEGYTLSFEYALSDKLSISAMPLGYYTSHVLNIVPSDVDRPTTTEWRSNVQLIHENSLRHFILTNRIAIDYRQREFPFTDHFQANWRFRYMLRFEKDVVGIFSAVKPVTFTLFDEVFFQFGDAVKNNHTIFDQHRLYLGATYEIVRNTSLTMGYAYGFQIRPSGDQYDDINSYYLALAFENFISKFSKPRSRIKRNA